MRTMTHPLDPAEHLGTLEAQAEYISAALEISDPAFIADSLGVVTRARGMSQLARDTGLRRESLYKALSAEGNPEFATIMKVVQALEVNLSAEVTWRRSRAGKLSLTTFRYHRYQGVTRPAADPFAPSLAQSQPMVRPKTGSKTAFGSLTFPAAPKHPPDLRIQHDGILRLHSAAGLTFPHTCAAAIAFDFSPPFDEPILPGRTPRE